MHAFGAGDRFLPLNLPRQRLERPAYASAAIQTAAQMRLISGALLFAGVYAQQPDAIVDFEVQLAPGAPVETFAVHVYRKWAPLGASRFLKLVDDGLLMDAPSSASSTDSWRSSASTATRSGRAGGGEVDKDAGAGEHIPKSNTRGRITFAHAGRNSRSTQLFINFWRQLRLR